MTKPQSLFSGGKINPFQKLARKTTEQVNYTCILLEGLFNILGVDILGMATIVPLFLSDLGASLGLIGALTTTQSIISALIPLLSGGFIAAAASKRRLSLTLNGLSRSLILLIPASLLLGFANQTIIVIFYSVMIFYFLCQPITGIAWNYLLGDCVSANLRGRLIGTLFAVSGFISFISSNIIKAIRGSSRLNSFDKYAAIFGLAGLLMAISVLCFVPLKERKTEEVKKEERQVKAYLASLLACLHSRDFRKLLRTNAFSYVSTAINSFLYVIAQNHLKLTTDQISNMLVIQTVGMILGGFTTGRVSSRFGTKRMLIMTESIGVAVPLLAMTSLHSSRPFYLMAAVVFILGFSKSGFMGYQTHLLEIADPDKTVYHIIAKSLVMLPLSFVSVAVGVYIERFPIQPVFILQIAACLFAVFSATRLRLIVYRKGETEESMEEPLH